MQGEVICVSKSGTVCFIDTMTLFYITNHTFQWYVKSTLEGNVYSDDCFGQLQIKQILYSDVQVCHSNGYTNFTRWNLLVIQAAPLHNRVMDAFCNASKWIVFILTVSDNYDNNT